MSAAEMREAAVRAAKRRAATHDDDSPAATLAELIALDIAALPLPDEEGMVERVGAAALQILFHLRETKWTVGPIHDDEPELWAAIVKEAGSAAIAAVRGEK